MPVSERDKDYMRRLGEFKAEGHARALAEHLALDPLERLDRSLRMWLQYRDSANLAKRVDDPEPFYERARRLGLYRP